jgi:hypothetical protein
MQLLTLPVIAEDGSMAAKANNVATPPRAAGLADGAKVLLVEDHDNLALKTKRQVERLGYQVTAANNARQASAMVTTCRAY